ncbi:hypothetical protein EDC01DRAFT_781932 [Geopyxis carbonaria]|nr:hypothetical protein EDC01DRAFT_781932 [Geopyxis carbonaria]
MPADIDLAEQIRELQRALEYERSMRMRMEQYSVQGSLYSAMHANEITPIDPKVLAAAAASSQATPVTSSFSKTMIAIGTPVPTIPTPPASGASNSAKRTHEEMVELGQSLGRYTAPPSKEPSADIEAPDSFEGSSDEDTFANLMRKAQKKPRKQSSFVEASPSTSPDNPLELSGDDIAMEESDSENDKYDDKGKKVKESAKVRKARYAARIKAIYVKCEATTHKQKVALGKKIRETVVSVGHRLDSPYTSYDDKLWSCLKTEVHNVLGPTYGVTRKECHLLMARISGHQGRNDRYSAKEETKSKKASKKAARRQSSSTGNKDPEAAYGKQLQRGKKKDKAASQDVIAPRPVPLPSTSTLAQAPSAQGPHTVLIAPRAPPSAPTTSIKTVLSTERDGEMIELVVPREESPSNNPRLDNLMADLALYWSDTDSSAKMFQYACIDDIGEITSAWMPLQYQDQLDSLIRRGRLSDGIIIKQTDLAEWFTRGRSTSGSPDVPDTMHQQVEILPHFATG